MWKVPVPLTRPTCSTPMVLFSCHWVMVMMSVVLKGPTLVRQENCVPTPSVVGEVKVMETASFIQLTCLSIWRSSSQRTSGETLMWLEIWIVGTSRGYGGEGERSARTMDLLVAPKRLTLYI